MRILHTMLRVGDLQRSIDFYTKVMGMELLRTTDRPEQKYRLAFVGYGDESRGAVLELTYNYGVDAYDLGSGFGHVAIEVDDVAAACARRARRGGRLRREGHARSGAGQRRDDRHRVRPGPRRLQDRADRAQARVVPRAFAAARSARGERAGVGALEKRLPVARETRGCRTAD